MARIAIHALALDPARQGGGETYVRCLLQAIDALDDVGGHRFTLLAGRGGTGLPPLRRFEEIRLPIDPSQRRRRILWEEFRLPGWLRQQGFDLVHFPYGTCPRTMRGPHVVTVHDTLRFFYPDEIPPIERAYKRFVEGSIRRNRPVVIAVSQTDADAFCRHVGYPADRVRAVWHGVNHTVFAPSKAPVTKQDLVAWVGRPYRRKNLDLILRAMVELQRGDPPIRLLAVGPSDAERAALSARAVALGVADRVRFHPAVPAAQLPELLAPAKVFCYPSRYESFGLPVIEAMACGLACVVAEHPVFRELHGNVPLYCDPDDPADLARQIERVIRDDALRSEMKAASVARAAAFTWERCAMQTLDAYRLALGGSR